MGYVIDGVSENITKALKGQRKKYYSYDTILTCYIKILTYHLTILNYYLKIICYIYIMTCYINIMTYHIKIFALISQNVNLVKPC